MVLYGKYMEIWLEIDVLFWKKPWNYIYGQYIEYIEV